MSAADLRPAQITISLIVCVISTNETIPLVNLKILYLRLQLCHSTFVSNSLFDLESVFLHWSFNIGNFSSCFNMAQIRPVYSTFFKKPGHDRTSPQCYHYRSELWQLANLYPDIVTCETNPNGSRVPEPDRR
jgi:hypothetical protein